MGKYSSDSDHEKRSPKKSLKSNRHRSTSSDSDSKIRRSTHKRRSKYSRSSSRDRYSKQRRSRSNSRQTHKSKSNRYLPKDYSKHRSKRSRSRDSKDRSRRSRSTSRTSKSKDHYRSRRSRSRSYIKEYFNTKRSSSSSSSSTDVSDSNSSKKNSMIKNTKKSSILINKSENNIDDMPIAIDSDVLLDITSDNFVQKKFFSDGSKKVLDNILIDLKKQTIKIPDIEPIEPDSVFHHNLFLSEEIRTEKWVKELFSYRQKALQQGFKTSRRLH